MHKAKTYCAQCGEKKMCYPFTVRCMGEDDYESWECDACIDEGIIDNAYDDLFSEEATL